MMMAEHDVLDVAEVNPERGGIGQHRPRVVAGVEEEALAHTTRSDLQQGRKPPFAGGVDARNRVRKNRHAVAVDNGRLRVLAFRGACIRVSCRGGDERASEGDKGKGRDAGGLHRFLDSFHRFSRWVRRSGSSARSMGSTFQGACQRARERIRREFRAFTSRHADLLPSPCCRRDSPEESRQQCATGAGSSARRSRQQCATEQNTLFPAAQEVADSGGYTTRERNGEPTSRSAGAGQASLWGQGPWLCERMMGP